MWRGARVTSTDTPRRVRRSKLRGHAGGMIAHVSDIGFPCSPVPAYCGLFSLGARPMEPFTIPAGTHHYVSALDAVSFYISDPGYMVWYSMSEVINAVLEPPDMFKFYLSDGREVYIEQVIRVCVYHRPF